MKYNFLYGIPAILLITIVFTPATAGPCNTLGYLDLTSADLFENPSLVSAKINVCDTIPALPAGAFGTGVLTDGTIVVTTTHPGVLDSETQANINDPIPHNHYVNLKNLQIPPNPQALTPTCLAAGATAEVDTISLQSPGIAMWQGNMYKIWEIPKSSPPGQYTDALSGAQLDFTLGSLTNLPPFLDYSVVSFTLVPALQENPPTVCVVVQQVLFENPINPLTKIAGEILSIDATALMISGMSTSAVWLLPVVVSAAGIGMVLVRKKF